MVVRDRAILYQRRNHPQDWRDSLSCRTPFAAPNRTPGWIAPSDPGGSERMSGEVIARKNVPRRRTTRSRIIFYEGIVSVLYIGSLTTRCCLASCYSPLLRAPLHLALPFSTSHTTFCHRSAFSFSHSVSVVSAGPIFLVVPLHRLHRGLLTVFFLLTPTHVSAPVASPRIFPPKRLTLAPSPFLRLVGILLPPPLSPGQPRASLAPLRSHDSPSRTVSLHDILLRVYDGTQLLLTFARTMSPCQVGKHVYLIACTDPLVLTLDSRARDAIYLVGVITQREYRP